MSWYLRMRITTDRLEIVAATAEMARSAFGDRERLCFLIDAVVPDDWPPEIMRDVMEFFAERLEQEPELQDGWWVWYIVHREDRVLIGSAGYSGLPDPDGTLVMGYSIIPAYQGQGYTTEAVKALIEWAFTRPGVEHVAAETYPDHTASLRVMQKAGMSYIRPGDDEGTDRYGISRCR